jgi:hypothetical protein
LRLARRVGHRLATHCGRSLSRPRKSTSPGLGVEACSHPDRLIV